MIAFENVFMRYGSGDNILSNVSFTLDRGSFHFLMGASGAGKTTLLKLMYLALFPTQGTVHVMDTCIGTMDRKDLPLLRRRIGVVFQDYQLLDHMTVFDNVALPLRVADASEKHVRDATHQLLKWVGLRDFIHENPAILSGGQKQRVAIARAVITNPDILIADEPTGGIDQASARKIMHLFKTLNEQGTTVVFATHSMDLVSNHSYPILNIKGGNIHGYPCFHQADLSGLYD